MTAGNQELAAQARDHADAAPAGSLGRKAWACAAVALGTTGTIATARKVLALVRPAEVREATLAALGQLATENQP